MGREESLDCRNSKKCRQMELNRMYETELSLFAILWAVVAFVYMVRAHSPPRARAIISWISIGLAVEGYVVWINGFIISAMGHFILIMVILIMPFLLRLTNSMSMQSSTQTETE